MPPPSEPPRHVLAGGGDMGTLMRSIDWSTTAVGPIERWPQSLRTALSILLETGFPMYIAWGAEFTQFYNDGYRPILGSTKHPAAMGRSSRETFAEIWNIIGPMFAGVMHGTPVFMNDFQLPLDRHGFVEECYFIFSYSPIREESGQVGGILVTVTETTERVLAARRLVTLQELASRAQPATTAKAACELAAAVLSQNVLDVPFAILYLMGDDGKEVAMAGASGLPPRSGAVAASIWPIAEVYGTGRGSEVDCPEEVGRLASRAVVLPCFTPGATKPSAVLVAALSPQLVFDAKYRSFLDLVAGHIGNAIGSARSLEEAKARAEALAEIDRAKTAFFSNVSHEFRTPLTLMLGPAEEALALDLDPAERERWDIVHRNALRLAKLVNTLLEFSRIEAGRVQANYERTDIVAFTNELASMFRSAVERAGLALRLDLAPLPEPAFIDREMWEKIVLNLLSNALKFTFEGEIALSLRMDGPEFVLTVRDTGVGMAAQELPFVFDRFHRVKETRARTHEGTGIGLALVAELTKLHGGSARVESEVDRGSSFIVRLPRGKDHLPADRVVAESALPSTAKGAAAFVEDVRRWSSPRTVEGLQSPSIARGPRARIVLADDNADMRSYLTRLLSERWDVEAVANGADALDALRRLPANLLVSDVMMPELDGFALLRAIRADATLRSTPVILLSARAGAEATAEGLDAGANDYIVKPFSARELLVRVASQLAVAEVVREATEIEAAARARLYNHFMQTPFPVAVLHGPEHVVELANSFALNAWGKTEAIVGKPLIEGIPELGGQPFIGYLDEVVRSGVAYQARGAKVLLRRSGSGNGTGAVEEVYFDFVYAPLRDASGKVEGVLVGGFEVTAQVRAAQELERMLTNAEASERQFRELVENLPALAWTARPDGYIDYYNRRWYEYTGTTLEQMQGWGWKAVHLPAMLDAVTERWTHSIATGEPFEMEFPLRGADGRFRWFLTRVRPLRDAGGRIVRWFGSNTNIDERRRNDDFKETFIGILGHDLRNPLNTILTTARVLALQPTTPAEIKKRMDRLVTSGVRMQRMIEQVLDLTRARLAQGIPITLSPEAVSLEPIVGKIADEIRTAHPQTRIDLHVEGDCHARIDVDRFEQVVSNLLGNAVTHGDPTKPVDVVLASRPGAVSLSVSNFGEPIGPESLPLLFNPFSRAKPQGHSAGLGLGLYICEQILAAHKGSISVRSNAVEGTCFEATVPRQP